MNDLNVSMRLKLLYQNREAKAAERDLKEIDSAAKKLGRNNAGDKLGRDLKEVSTAAKRGKTAVNELEAETRRLNRVKTDTVEKEIRALGTAARKAATDIDHMRQRLKRFDGVKAKPLEQMATPTRELNGAMGLLATSAGNAMLALGAFASVDNILRGLEQMSAKFRDLNRDVASVAVTAEMRTPEAIQKISKSNEKLAMRYGRGQSEVNAARKAYAAAGIGLESQETVLDPTLKAAKAEDSTGETIATAMIAAKQALGVQDSDVPAALDMMAKGAKLGSFEVDAMAKNFPALGTMLAGTGRKGLQGWAELVALSQIVRMGAGSQDEAATNLQNLIAKLTSQDTVKNFSEKGVDLSKLRDKAEKEGKPYLMAVMDKVMELTGGDTFKIGELFGDQQAGLALKPLLANRPLYEEFLKQIQSQSAGTVDQDYQFLHDLPKERADRRAAALEATGAQAGSWWDAVSSPVKDWFIRNVNPAYGWQEKAYQQERYYKTVDPSTYESQIAEKQKQLDAMPKPRFGDVDMLGSARQTLEQEIQRLQQELDTVRRFQPDNGDLGKSTGKIPIPAERPVRDKLGGDLGPAADQAMSGYNERLTIEGDKAVKIAAEKAAAMKSVLNFTATPTIVPNVAGSSGPPSAPASGEKHSSIVNNTGVRLSQNIRSSNPRQVARLSARENDRAIRRALANAYHDTGRRIT